MLALLAAPASAADYIGTFSWQSRADDHGGFSGLELDESGTSFAAISDRAAIVQGRILRVGGEITGIEAEPIERLRDRHGKPLPQNTRGDSEGLAVGPDGRLYVSFEGNHRVRAYDAPDTAAEDLPANRAFKRLPQNGSLEALASDADGALYTLPETPDAAGFPLWRLRDGQWALIGAIPQIGKFVAVGLDLDDQGRLYLLERHFAGLFGFATRVRRFALTDDGPVGGEVLFETTPGTHDNLEGIAVWRDATGGLRLTMISDDNFSFLQRTELVEYALPE